METCIICNKKKNEYITIFGKPICDECQNSFSQEDTDDYDNKISIIRKALVTIENIN